MKRSIATAGLTALALACAVAPARANGGDGPITVVTPAPPIVRHACWFDTFHNTIYVSFGLGVKGSGERTVIEVSRPTSAVALAYPMPQRGWLRWTPPGGLSGAHITAMVAGVRCERT